MSRSTTVFTSLVFIFTLCTAVLPAAAEVPTSCVVKAGPIWHNADAERKCPEVCKNGYGPWGGGWWTTEPGKQSVCVCGTGAEAFDAGLIFNNDDAKKKCPGVCVAQNAAWNEHWWTTEPGKKSVCLCSNYCPPQK
jgi:Mannan-binding protein